MKSDQSVLVFVFESLLWTDRMRTSDFAMILMDFSRMNIDKMSGKVNCEITQFPNLISYMDVSPVSSKL